MMKSKISVLILAALICLINIPVSAEDTISSATIDVSALPDVAAHDDATTLVVYFSTNDTIRAAALTAADALDADVFEIEPSVPYTAEDLNYNDSSSRATMEQRDEATRPDIAAWPENLGQYDLILLGYPIWWGQAPRILYNFLDKVDVCG